MRAGGLGAIYVQSQSVFIQGKAALFGDACLSFLNFGIVEFLNAATLQADQMVVMPSLVKFENGFAK